MDATDFHDGAPKRHAACDECRTKKLKCTGEQPKCSRCEKKGIECIYALQKTMGRPRKRRMLSEDDDQVDAHPTEAPLAAGGALKPSNHLGVWTLGPDSPYYNEGEPARGFGTSLLPELPVNSWPSLDPDTYIPPEGSFTEQSITSGSSSNLGNTSSHSTPGTSADGSTSAVNDSSSTSTADSCACLSSMYLCMSNLQNMTDFSFPGALFTVRQTIRTAWVVLHCQECPKVYFTAFQNVHMLGMLIVGLAERYCKILSAIDAEAEMALVENRTLSMRIGDLGGSSMHLHSADPEVCMARYNIDLAPMQWRKLVKGVVRGEVKGSPADCCPSYQSLIDGLENRQMRWHMTVQPYSCPRKWTEEEIKAISDKNHVSECLRMVHEARNIVGQMSFD